MQKNGEKNNITDLSDENLVQLYSAGNIDAQEIMFKRYKNFVRSKARVYFLAGGDNEDIVQEGMIGLYKALRDFDVEKQSSFRTFAGLCIKRQIITAIKSATRNKHMPLNHYISFNDSIFENINDKTVFDALGDQVISDPEEIMLVNEAMDEVRHKVSSQLSLFEKNVLSLFLEGFSYYEISQKLNKHQKSIDNALQRIKKKLGKSNP